MSKDTWLVNPAHYLETHGCPEQHLWLAVVERAFLDYADFYQYLGGNHNDSQRLRLLRLGDKLSPHNLRGLIWALQELEYFFFGPSEEWTLHYISDACFTDDMVMYRIREDVAARYEASLEYAIANNLVPELVELMAPLKFKSFSVSPYQICSRIAQHYKVGLPTQSARQH